MCTIERLQTGSNHRLDPAPNVRTGRDLRSEIYFFSDVL